MPAYQDPAHLRYLTVHVVATPEGRDVKAPEVTAYDTGRFGQASYHKVIELDGTVVRTLRDDQRGCHVKDANTGNIGISGVGGLARDAKTAKNTWTPAQLTSLGREIDEYRERYPALRLAGAIRGHRDWSPDLNHNGKIEPFEWIKVCPCFDVHDWLVSRGTVQVPTAPAAFGDHKVIATVLNVRAFPSAASTVLGKLEHGATVTVARAIGDWANIGRGWVAARYLQAV